jgi:hypothetical protein
MGQRGIWLNGVRVRMGVLALPLALAAGCSTGPPSGSLADRIQSSPEKEALEKAGANVGRTFWVQDTTILDAVRVCTQSVRPADRCSYEHGKLMVLDAVDGTVAGPYITRWYGQVLTFEPAPFYYVATEDGSKGYAEASELERRGTTVDPAITAANTVAECKRRGDPRTGMSAAQVIATCWGNRSHRASSCAPFALVEFRSRDTCSKAPKSSARGGALIF